MKIDFCFHSICMKIADHMDVPPKSSTYSENKITADVARQQRLLLEIQHTTEMSMLPI